MRGAWIGCAALAAALHVVFFVVESVLFPGTPAIQERFEATTPEQVEAMRVLFLNQGFYNLFLAVGTFAGIGLAVRGASERAQVAGRAIVTYSCLVMAAAGVVLLLTTGKAAGAVVQAAPPGLALLFGWLHTRAAPAQD